MALQVVALVLSSISVAIGLTTLSLVIRNELRERRMNGPIMWDFHRYATRSGGTSDEVLEVAQLVQFGRQPTRILHYHPVGFELVLEEGYRLRSHVKAEDVMPLLLRVLDPDNAWVLISHFPRDDRRWLVFEWVGLSPSTEVFQQVFANRQDELRDAEKGLKRYLQDLWSSVTPKKSVIRPVGPTGYAWARIRADRGPSSDILEASTEIIRLAFEGSPTGSYRAY